MLFERAIKYRRSLKILFFNLRYFRIFYIVEKIVSKLISLNLL